MADTVSSTMGEESDLEVLQPWMPSGERSPSMHEVGRYAAYKGGMPSAV